MMTRILPLKKVSPMAFQPGNANEPCGTERRMVAFSTLNPVAGAQTLRISFPSRITLIASSPAGQQK